jgi:outer membrane protein assembly factor BamB
MTHFRPKVLAMALGIVMSVALPDDGDAGPLLFRRRVAVPCQPMPQQLLQTPPVEAKAPPQWPMFGGTPQRNMVNLFDKNLPATWSVEEGKQKNVKWTARLGSRTFGSPVVTNGKVFVPTNGRTGNDPWQAVLMALRESDGKLLWQNAHDHPKKFLNGWAVRGVPSTPAADGERIYYLIPGCEVICADCDTGKVHWRYDVVKEHDVFPSPGVFHSTPPLASPLVVGDLVFAATSNGINWEGDLVAPRAASFVALHKKTGKLAWQSNLPGDKIYVGGWSSPTFANVNNVPQVIFAGGDSVIYSFVPETGELLWKCDCLPAREKMEKYEFDNFFIGTPVVVEDRLYVGQGIPDDTVPVPKASYFLCLDITKKGDVSLKSYDAKADANKNSALVWAFGGPVMPVPKKGRKVNFGPTISTAAVHDGLVYIPETTGYLHCLDAATGREVWQHDFKAVVWGSPYWVDGRVFVGTDDGTLVIFTHGRERKVLAMIDFDTAITATPVAANGVLYVMTQNRLYAIAHDKKEAKR